MNRITAEEVVKAYQETGLKPIHGAYKIFDAEGNAVGACGLGVISHQRNPIDTTDLDILNLTESYRLGFVCGFDSLQLTNFDMPTSLEEYNAGFEDGTAARLAVLPKRITELAV